MNEELETIESLAKHCDEELAIELNRRLQEILDWAILQVANLKDEA